MRSIQSSKLERDHQYSCTRQPDHVDKGKVSHHEKFYSQEGTSCRVARDFSRPDGNDAVDGSYPNSCDDTGLDAFRVSMHDS